MATNPKTKKIIIWSSVAVILGVGGYFLFQYLKKRREGNGSPESDGGNVLNEPTPSPTPSAEVSSDRPTSKEDIKAFQNYVLTVKKDATILGKSGADGVWGSNSQKAWEKYGSDYKKSVSNNSAPSNDKELERAINLILGKASNSKGKATRSYLTSAEPSFVKRWAWNLDNERSAFGWANGVYRVKTGEQLLSYNPIDDSVVSKSDAISVHREANSNSGRTEISRMGTKIGTVKAVKFDGTNVWFYVPNYSTVYKWVKSKDVKKG